MVINGISRNVNRFYWRQANASNPILRKNFSSLINTDCVQFLDFINLTSSIIMTSITTCIL